MDDTSITNVTVTDTSCNLLNYLILNIKFITFADLCTKCMELANVTSIKCLKKRGETQTNINNSWISHITLLFC